MEISLRETFLIIMDVDI